MMHTYKKTEGGFALLLAIIVSSVMLAIGVSILKISVNQVNLSATARESEFAFQAAHAGIDCMTYWRNEEATVYTDISSHADGDSVPVSPVVSCFGVTAPTQTVDNYVNNGVINTYRNTFSWGGTGGTPARCTETDLYVMTGIDGHVDLHLPGRGLGTNDVKRCNDGRICNLLISRGYNRACRDIGSSIYSVQRELTQEF